MPLRLRSAGGGSVQLNSPVALATDVSMEVPAYAGAKILTDKTPGSVLQVVRGTAANSGTTSTSTSFINDGLSVTIVPKFAGSKILIHVQSGCSVAGGYAYFRIFESVSGVAVTQGDVPWGNFSGSPQQLSGVNLMAWYTAPDLAARTFQLQGYCNAGTRYINYSSQGLMVAMEIAA